MRVSPEDRRNLGQFGLAVMVIGLVVAPLAHVLGDHAGLRFHGADGELTHRAEHAEDGDGHQHGHDHGHPHRHEPAGPRPHTHQDGSIQHLTAVFSAPAAPPAVVQVFRSFWPVPETPEQRVAVATFTPAMPQGP